MNALPRPTPAFTIQTGGPVAGIVKHSDPVIPPAGADSLGFDAALPRGAGVAFSMVTAAWENVALLWRGQIASEQLADVQIRHYRTPTDTAPHGLRVRPTDGALQRMGDRGVAYTEHAWSQLISLLLQEVPSKPRGPSEPFRWLSPSVRALVFADVRNRSRREEGEGHEVILRSFVDARSGARALRAVLSGRHSGIHFDDLALSRVLDRVIPHDAPAYVSRSVNQTKGYAVLDVDQAAECRASLSWENSETGCASLSFSGGVYLSVLDALIVGGKKITTGADLGVAELAKTQVTIAQSNKSTRRAHTLPRKDRSEAERAEIASKRIRADVDSATKEAFAMCEAWAAAKLDMAPGYVVGVDVKRGGTLSEKQRKVDAMIVVDAIEENTRGFTAEDRKGLEQILADNDRLATLPYMSAALIAGAWAVMAREQSDWEEAARMMEEAHRWITKGFKR